MSFYTDGDGTKNEPTKAFKDDDKQRRYVFQLVVLHYSSHMGSLVVFVDDLHLGTLANCSEHNSSYNLVTGDTQIGNPLLHFFRQWLQTGLRRTRSRGPPRDNKCARDERLHLITAMSASDAAHHSLDERSSSLWRFLSEGMVIPVEFPGMCGWVLIKLRL